jgi:stalled ribosome rescue protein Dom34
MSDIEVAASARELLDKLHAEEITAFHELYAARENNGRATTDVANAARAATFGAIATLLVDIDTTVPGMIDEETGAVTFDSDETATNYGVIDEIARRALLTGAKVLAVRSTDLKGNSGLAAILRYPV